MSNLSVTDLEHLFAIYPYLETVSGAYDQETFVVKPELKILRHKDLKKRGKPHRSKHSSSPFRPNQKAIVEAYIYLVVDDEGRGRIEKQQLWDESLTLKDFLFSSVDDIRAVKAICISRSYLWYDDGREPSIKEMPDFRENRVEHLLIPEEGISNVLAE